MRRFESSRRRLYLQEIVSDWHNCLSVGHKRYKITVTRPGGERKPHNDDYTSEQKGLRSGIFVVEELPIDKNQAWKSA